MNQLVLTHAVRIAEEQLGAVRFGIIYVAVCRVNGKCYVGLTARSLDERITEHLQQARRGDDTHFHNALRLHGESAFTWFVLESGIPLVALDAREVYWIAVLGSFWHGYNATKGGEGVYGWTHSPETRAKLSAMAQGRTHSPETRAKLSEVQRRRVDNGTHQWLGEKNPVHRRIQDGTHYWLSDEHRESTRVRMREVTRRQLEDGTHNFQKLTPAQIALRQERSRIATRKNIVEGTHNFCGDSNPMRQRAAEGTHPWQTETPEERKARYAQIAATHRDRAARGEHNMQTPESRERMSQFQLQRSAKGIHNWQTETLEQKHVRYAKTRQTRHQNRQNDLAEERRALIESGQQVFC